ncbi:MAG: sirohydrochlorin cobaltochelatase [Deltaproteobacteria bacterium]|nr:sirohydrochlorin cobaltochelatase [Deltaproteobacteria bacterium]
MEHDTDEKAIVIACFGATYPKALIDITTIRKEVQKAFPRAKVKVAFTSNIIRRIWHERQRDTEYRAKNGDADAEILCARGPLATIADLQDAGYKVIIVQPTHIYAGEEYHDLASYIDGLNAIRTIKAKYMPFKKLVLGRPLLGKPGPQYNYRKDMIHAAKALAPDVSLAKKNHAALVYMGHGNRFYSTGVYIEFQQVMRRMYAGTDIFVGTVEGFPSLEDVVNILTRVGVKKVVLKPFMMVAGEHARNDMAGDQDDSWKSVIRSEGITVTCVLQGLGKYAEIRHIFIEHIKDVARDNKIPL